MRHGTDPHRGEVFLAYRCVSGCLKFPTICGVLSGRMLLPSGYELRLRQAEIRHAAPCGLVLSARPRSGFAILRVVAGVAPREPTAFAALHSPIGRRPTVASPR